MDGDIHGVVVDDWFGLADGNWVGDFESDNVGYIVGYMVGYIVGYIVGYMVGVVGEELGWVVAGCNVDIDGFIDVSTFLGDIVGVSHGVFVVLMDWDVRYCDRDIDVVWMVFLGGVFGF